MPLTNNNNVPLYIAAYLAYDDYDYDSRSNVISATTLIKNTKKIVMSDRVKNYALDITDIIKARVGQSIHGAVESVWTDSEKRVEALTKLGYSKAVIDSITINPSVVSDNMLPVYLEQRLERELDGYIIRGKFDFCAEGILRDTKTTSTYTYTKQTKLDDYILQLSIYKWLAPNMVTEDYGYIDYIFTDWKASLAKVSKDYPQYPHYEQKIPLMSLADTEDYIRNKLREIKKYSLLPEENIPVCSSEDLWQEPTKYKYFSKETNTKASKTFTSFREANAYLNEKGKGVIKTITGKAKACSYCKAYDICKQRELLHIDEPD